MIFRLPAPYRKLLRGPLCMTCRFFTDSECRRHAPKPFLVSSGGKIPTATCMETIWPMVKYIDRCGEYKRSWKKILFQGRLL